jgi:hypothetical protein
MKSDAATSGLSTAAKEFESLPDTAGVPVGVPAIILGVSVGTVWRWVRDGRLDPPDKIGPNTTRFNVGKLRRNIAALRSPAAA